jgi:cyclopropane-fatty-acyl-phospholipid synthase
MMTSTDNFDAGVTHVTAENFNSLVKNYPWRVRQALGFALMLERGALEVHLPDGCKFRFAGSEDGPEALMIIHDLDFARHLASGGEVGISEAFLHGHWESPNLTRFLELFCVNQPVIQRLLDGKPFVRFLQRVRHWMNRNTKAGSKRNIHAHYDLGNQFYSAWLDKTMTYSSALFTSQTGDLASAQTEKYANLAREIDLRAEHHVLEIGCGWGGFAEMAVDQGLAVTGLTLSPAQLAWAQQRVPAADLRLQDYRDTNERFDHIVSIEMFEAVGERFWPGYFKTVARALKPGGRAVIQSITIRDDLFASYRKGTDFIQQYIFPGGMLPSRRAFRAAAARQGLAVRHEYAFGLDYARTLAEWRHAFEAHWPAIAAQGFDETFRRLWRMYLCYCEAGFLAGNVDVVQFELTHR